MCYQIGCVYLDGEVLMVLIVNLIKKYFSRRCWIIHIPRTTESGFQRLHIYGNKWWRFWTHCRWNTLVCVSRNFVLWICSFHLQTRGCYIVKSYCGSGKIFDLSIVMILTEPMVDWFLFSLRLTISVWQVALLRYKWYNIKKAYNLVTDVPTFLWL